MTSVLEANLEKIKTQLKNRIKPTQKILVLGIGEQCMGDDGFGPYIAVHFHKEGMKNNNVLFINGKTDYTERQTEILNFKPDVLLILDTCRSGDPPGTLILAEESELVNYLPISTHVLPIQVFIQVLKNHLPTLNVYLLGVNPYNMDHQEVRSPYMPEKYSLDDFDKDPDLPFYEFNLSEQMIKIIDKVIQLLEEVLF